MSSPPQIQAANLDHLGLVAGMIDAIGIVEKINRLVGTQPGEKVSYSVKIPRASQATEWTVKL